MATAPQLAKSQVISLVEAGISESQLESLIADDPTILGLGDDLLLIERQRRHEGAGRLDLLLEDREEEIRYEVELMLGSLNESHIIRTIEYWDIERRRYPAYDHRAVVIAEDITSRFLNVIQLFSGSIPLIALQVNCIRMGDQVALVFIPLLVSTELRIDDRPEVSGKGADRAYWTNRAGQTIVAMADEFAAIVNTVAQRKRSLTYQKQYIGLADGGSPNNFVYFRPKKSFIGIRAKTDNNERWVKEFEAIGMDATIGGGRLKVNVTAETLKTHRSIVEDLLTACVKEDEG